ncbi:tyrosine-type recombinase/integrase [Alkalibaculum sp. M08DMB]|uniref:Tyrosine-type recombinase/integrase n=2 Tax=Alkalibaculum sporogenes TaxID=2655001 RepID=A0A6A7K9S2_9FIRM|nr:tyrosine-type recombinase/integrase [Alkalibaculum sporogenes]MPW25803.1 tyrosine-type recombinase/integrase [Alkalibaculum sporogenes]
MDTFTKDQNTQLTIKLRKLINDLPTFVETFFRGIEPNTSIKTRIAYAFDLRTFFYYITEELENFYGKKMKELNIEDLDVITSIDIEKFMEFLSFYSLPNYKNPDQFITYTNSNSGKARKLSTIRTFYRYFFKKELIISNPALLVDLPKSKEKAIIRLEVDEVANLLDTIETGENLSASQKKYHEHNKERDLALIALLLGTGIRISECVGLEIQHFNFENNSFRIIRKGGSETILYFSDEVQKILTDYISVRESIIPYPGHENAFFLSLQRKRLGVSAIQKLVKKYASIITPLKNISPHKLRSTYGTNLYRETGDIYLVADVLGHKDVNTTKKHYAAISDDQKRSAAKIVKLRED